jgi:hypothetical protein
MRHVALLGSAIFFLSSLSGGAFADPFALTDSVRCGAGNASNGIAIGDVTGNSGGANECWGAFTGNDPKDDGFSIDGHVYEFVAKENTPGGLEGDDIGLVVSPSGGALSGTWEFIPGSLGGDPFLIVLKAANNPGFAVWLFDGAAADSFMGNWQVAWNRNLSHLSVYQGERKEMPVPATPALLGLGLALARIVRRKR